MLKFIQERKGDYDPRFFINELADASKNLGVLEAKISAYQFNSILVPMLNRKEAISSMNIEGKQTTTMSDTLRDDVNPNKANEKVNIEVHNHIRTLAFGSSYLNTDVFSHIFIQELHKRMLNGITAEEDKDKLGKYKTKNNHIESSNHRVIFTPPSYKETQKFMDELISYMNNTYDGINPLIKAAIIHSQFESIHPFYDGNGRVGRLLVSLYLYKAKVINFPFFYISEAIGEDKGVYYNMLTDSRGNSLNNWIKFFLSKINIQAKKHIGYIDSLNNLYVQTKKHISQCITSTKIEMLIDYLFTHPILNADLLYEALGVSRGQALRYLDILEKERILLGDDRKRGRTFFFDQLLVLANGF